MDLSELIDFLPEIIWYLADGFAVIMGIYFFHEKRFRIFSDVSFWAMLIAGFVCCNIGHALYNVLKQILPLLSEGGTLWKNIVLFVICFAVGVFVSWFRKVHGEKIGKCLGRSKTVSENFWNTVLNYEGKTVTLRLKNYNGNRIVQGRLIFINEDDENPYFVLDHCIRYDLNGVVDDESENCKDVRVIVRSKDFDEISAIYQPGKQQ